MHLKLRRGDRTRQRTTPPPSCRSSRLGTSLRGGQRPHASTIPTSRHIYPPERQSPARAAPPGACSEQHLIVTATRSVPQGPLLRTSHISTLSRSSPWRGAASGWVRPDFPGQLGTDLSAALPGGRRPASSPTPPYHRRISPDLAQRVPREARQRNGATRTGYVPRRRLGRRQTAVTMSPERSSTWRSAQIQGVGNRAADDQRHDAHDRAFAIHPVAAGRVEPSASSGWLRAAGIGTTWSRDRGRLSAAGGASYPRNAGCPSSTAKMPDASRKGGLLTGDGAVVSKHGREGDERDAAGVGCYRNSSSGGARPERALDAPIGTWATETISRPSRAASARSRTPPWVDSSSKIETADVADDACRHAPPPLAKETLDQPASSMPWRCTNGRTSTTPPSRAAGQRAAISSTGSRLSASKR